MVVYTVDMSLGFASTIGAFDTTRGIPKRFPKAFEIISNCAGQMENVSEILWVILRSLSRDIENFPMSVTDVECCIHEDSINRSFNPLSPQSLPIDAIKHDIE
jgi:hypothetical protein